MLCCLSSQSLAQQTAYPLADHLGAARNYMQQQRWDYASYEWRNVLNNSPKLVEAHLGLAEALRKSGFVNEAIQQLQTAQKQSPDIQVDIALAQAHTQTGHSGKAADLYQGVLKQNPYNAQAFRGLKALLPRLAADQKNRHALLLKQTAETAKNKAQIFVKEGNFAEASQYYEIISAYYPKLSYVNDHGLVLLLAGRRSEADQKFTLLNRSGKYYYCDVHPNTAMVALSLGHHAKAQRLMEESIGGCRNMQKKARLFNNLGYIYESARQWDKARYAYQQAVQMDPSLIKAQLNLGYLYQRDREYERAVKLYKTLLERNPGHARAWNELGFVYEQMFEPKSAIHAYKKAISANPTYKEAYYNLGTLYRKEDKLDEADAMFQRMADLDFKRMETKNQTPQQAILFDTVDLFFAEPVL